MLMMAIGEQDPRARRPGRRRRRAAHLPHRRDPGPRGRARSGASAEEAGRDPASVRVWAVLATVEESIPEEAAAAQAGRPAGDVPPGVRRGAGARQRLGPRRLERFRSRHAGATATRARSTPIGTIEQLTHLRDEVLPARVAGRRRRPARRPQCAARIQDQLDAGADSVILHGATPTELAPVRRRVARDPRPERASTGCRPTPGWSAMSADVVCTPDELTPAWLSAALGRAVEVRRLEHGRHRPDRHLLPADAVRHRTATETVLAKLPAAGPGHARACWPAPTAARCASTADSPPTVAVRSARAATSPRSPRTRRLHAAARGPRAGASRATRSPAARSTRPRDAVVNLAGLHGPRWCDPTLLDGRRACRQRARRRRAAAELYGPATELFLDGLGDLLARRGRRHAARRAWRSSSAGRWRAPSGSALVHGDYRLDNLMFPPDGGRRGRRRLADAEPGAARPRPRLLPRHQPRRSTTGARTSATWWRRTTRRSRRTASPATRSRTCWDDYRFAMVQGPLVVGLRLRLRHPHRARRPDVRGDGAPAPAPRSATSARSPSRGA